MVTGYFFRLSYSSIPFATTLLMSSAFFGVSPGFLLNSLLMQRFRPIDQKKRAIPMLKKQDSGTNQSRWNFETFHIAVMHNPVATPISMTNSIIHLSRLRESVKRSPNRKRAAKVQKRPHIIQPSIFIFIPFVKPPSYKGSSPVLTEHPPQG